ncbi:high-affinity nickel-transport protein [Aureococcus anophagefferens]|nr:high-affinity nickel-transport protein [Aureococcus anophagefferens]
MGRKTTIASPFAMYAVRLTLGAIVAINVALVAALLSLGARYPALVSPGLLALGFGLRHGVDCDHIADHRQPSALTAAGAAVSAAFSAVMLSTLGVVNLASIGPQFREWRAAARGEAAPSHGSGVRAGLPRCCKPVLASVDSQWKMYVVGVLFGLGFETASEFHALAIVGISFMGAVACAVHASAREAADEARWWSLQCRRFELDPAGGFLPVPSPGEVELERSSRPGSASAAASALSGGALRRYVAEHVPLVDAGKLLDIEPFPKQVAALRRLRARRRELPGLVRLPNDVAEKRRGAARAAPALAAMLGDFCAIFEEVHASVDKALFYDRYRPLLSGSWDAPLACEAEGGPCFTSGQGPSAGQSTIFLLLDIALGVARDDSEHGAFQRDMLAYMPPAHRALVDDYADRFGGAGPLANLCRRGVLRRDRDARVATLAKLRSFHLGVASDACAARTRAPRVGLSLHAPRRHRADQGQKAAGIFGN